MTFTFDNHTGKTPTRVLLGLLWHALHQGYSVACFTGPDIIAGRRERTRRGAVEVELYEDGSGLEAAFLGRWLVFGVEAKRGALALPIL
ncbi:MAG: hypothetical protein ACYCY9_03800 [Thiobacillus sp.]